MTSKLCVLGPSGRMGAMVCQRAAHSPLVLTCAIERPDHRAVGKPVGTLTITSDLAGGIAAADVYIDFTSPAGTTAAARLAAEHKTAAVIGTTGLDDNANAAIDQLASVAPVVVAANFSLGVNVLLILAEQAARALGSDFDLEVVEMHHRHKRDAPSGTALALGDALARGRDWQRESVQRLSREGDVGPRPDDEIGFATLRGGSVIGEHTALLIGERERLELTHRAHSREIFADGALRAAQWVTTAKPGLYGMKDVLGLG